MSNSNTQGNQIFELPQSVSDQIYKMLRQRILDHEIHGGDRLIETSLAKEFSISRTPIRESLRRLEQDGLAERVPQGGLRVVKISTADIKDLYGIRSVLGTYAAELACEYIDEDTLIKLKRINGNARFVIEDASLASEEQAKRLFQLNTRFHETIHNVAGSPRLSVILANLRDLVLRYRILCLQDESIRQEACDEHERIVKLLEARDKASLAPLMRKHILAGGEAAVRALLTIEKGKK